jgi:hypothetical protein
MAQDQQQQGLSTDQHKALDAWGQAKGIQGRDLEELRMELALSASRRAEVFGATATGAVEVIEEKGVIGSTIDFFRNGLNKVLVGLGIIGLVGGSLYIGKQALDAAQETYDESLREEFGERSKAMMALASQTVSTATNLAAAMFDFLMSVPVGMADSQNITNLVRSLWTGIREDGKEFLEGENKNLSPDKINKEIAGAILAVPELKMKWKKVAILLKTLQMTPARLGRLQDEILSFSDEDKAQAWNRFEDNFWDQMKDPFTKKDDEVEQMVA